MKKVDIILELIEESVAKKKDEKLWKKIVSEVKRGDKGGKVGQWSARKAQIAVKKYKEAGGKYEGKKSKSNSLSKWTKQKWTTKSGKKSSETGERYLPKKAIENLTDEEYKKTSEMKRKGKSQFVKQPKEIADKVKKFRK